MTATNRTRYTEDHEWVRDGGSEPGEVYVVGISDYAQEQLGEIVYVELPEAGGALTRGDEAAVVESVKAAGEIKSPLSGKVVEVNDKLSDSPELVNDHPESDGWLYKMRAAEPQQLDELMDADAYRKFVQSLE